MEITKKRQEFHDHLFEFLYPRINKPKGSVEKIIHYVDKDNYLQILYTYGFEVIKELLLYFLDIEDYETCVIIRDTIEKNNKATGVKHIL